MIIDSSALMAIVLAEPDAGLFLAAMQGADSLRIAAPTLVELRIAAERRRGQGAVDLIADLLEDFEVEVAAFDEELADAAHDAWRRFGKGNHPASLNLGDTFSYALAQLVGEPLLCKGHDFRQTDVRLAI